MRRNEGLTPRELDVLELALRGLTHQQIATRLHLSVDTVKTHFRRVYAAVRDDAGQPARGALHAVALALQQGLMVYDEATRTVRRPDGQEPLPAYADLEPGQSAARPRTPAERRADLGW